MIRRRALRLVENALDRQATVVLIGLRRVGKTTPAMTIADQNGTGKGPRNTGKRLVKSPKVHVRDSGLVHALLGIEDFNELAEHPEGVRHREPAGRRA